MAIKEILFSVDLARAPSWTGVVGPSGRTAHVKCGKGHIASLAEHTIAEDGTVTPSVVCPWGGCDYHEFIQLIGWGDKPKKPRKSRRKAQLYKEQQ